MAAAAHVLGVELRMLLVLAGAAQLLLAGASLAIPRVLGWREQVRPLPLLTRQVFWTYAAYVLGAHVAFGLVSLLAPEWLLAGTGLARAAAFFIAAWWGARLLIALFWFDTSDLPGGRLVALADKALLLLFIALTAIYVLAGMHG